MFPHRIEEAAAEEAVAAAAWAPMALDWELLGQGPAASCRIYSARRRRQRHHAMINHPVRR